MLYTHPPSATRNVAHVHEDNLTSAEGEDLWLLAFQMDLDETENSYDILCYHILCCRLPADGTASGTSCFLWNWPCSVTSCDHQILLGALSSPTLVDVTLGHRSTLSTPSNAVYETPGRVVHACIRGFSLPTEVASANTACSCAGNTTRQARKHAGIMLCCIINNAPGVARTNARTIIPSMVFSMHEIAVLCQTLLVIVGALATWAIYTQGQLLLCPSLIITGVVRGYK